MTDNQFPSHFDTPSSSFHFISFHFISFHFLSFSFLTLSFSFSFSFSLSPVQRNHFQIVNSASGAKYSFTTESPSEKRRWIDSLQAEILRVSNASWRDAYDQDFQLHENTTSDGKRDAHEADKKSPTLSPSIRHETSVGSGGGGSIGKNKIGVTYTDSFRSGSDEIEVNTFSTIQRLLGDPYSLLSYTKTMGSCTSVMVNQLNAKAMISDDLDRREQLWTSAKVIADATVSLTYFFFFFWMHENNIFSLIILVSFLRLR